VTSVAGDRSIPTRRRSIAAGGSAALKGSVIPVIQLAAAGLTLGLWVLVDRWVSSSYEVLSVTVFSTSAVLALTLTAGIAYVLPNQFRAADRSSWSEVGAWSSPISIAIAVNRVAASAGAVLALIAIAVPELAVTAATLAAGSILSMAILTAQLARLADSTWAMATALAPNPFIPLCFLVLHGLGVPLDWAVAMFCVAALALGEAIVRRYRSMTVPLAAVDRSAVGSTVRSAGPLVPHLLCFAAIMQGPRLMEAIGGSSSQLVASHQVMLLVAVGTTVITSFHGYISVSLQSTTDATYHERLRGFGLRYGAIGAAASLAVAALLLAAPRVIDGFAPLDGPGRIAVIAALPIISTYYALSAQLVRAGRTTVLAVVSATTLAIYALLSALAPASTASGSFVRYALCLAALPIVLWVVTARVDPSQRLPLARLAATAAVGFVPLVLLIALSPVAAWMGS
jgi:hypothetical protein